MTVLGCSGAEFPGHNPPAFLIDDSLLLDGGTIGSILGEDRQQLIRHICITHSHLDHIRGIPALADNIVVGGRQQTIDIIGIGDVLTVLKEHLMNGQVWPDFSVIPAPDAAAVKYREILPERCVEIGGFAITACRVSHSVPAAGFIIEKEGKKILYTGDTGPTERLWSCAGKVTAAIVEVSFPDAMEDMALLTGHLTTGLLKRELAKLPESPGRIFITHLKPQYSHIIAAELQTLGLPQLELLRQGMTYDI